MSINLNEAFGTEVYVSNGYFEEFEAHGKAKSVELKQDEVSKNDNFDALVTEVLTKTNHDSTGVGIEKSFEVKHDETINESDALKLKKSWLKRTWLEYDLIQRSKLLEVGYVIETLDQAYMQYGEYGCMM